MAVFTETRWLARRSKGRGVAKKHTHTHDDIQWCNWETLLALDIVLWMALDIGS